jgi:hypothetical protein
MVFVLVVLKAVRFSGIIANINGIAFVDSSLINHVPDS